MARSRKKPTDASPIRSASRSPIAATQAGLRPDEITIVAPENPLTVDAGATRTTSVFVLLPRTGFANGERMITISVTDGRRYQESVNYRLLGPVGNAPTGKFR